LTVDGEVRSARRSAGLFVHADRGLIEVGGADARRWLNGMVTNDVALLAEGPDRSGCPALVLTNKGRVVTDLQVLLTPHGFWLELPRVAASGLLERLAKFVIADDVSLTDRSDAFARFGLEGPAARAVLARVLGTPLVLAPEACVVASIAGADVVIARFGWSGEDGFQLFVPRESAAAVRERLEAQPDTVVPCTAEALEVLRIEAGRPRLGAELSLDVLPPEARLERALSYTKGCYTGQEIIARLRSRGHVNHLLVGLGFDGRSLPARGASVRAGDAVIGEITSATLSPHAGAIALAFVRVGHDAPDTVVDVDAARARVVALPFVEASRPAS
jgi:folate-binding protein YgfZ